MRWNTDVLPDQAQGRNTDRACGGAAPPIDALRGRTILVADAHADTRELYAICLRSAGARILDASDGRDALAKVFGERPDAIIADCQLPFIDGLELCRLIRLDAATARLPVILVTATAATAPADELPRAGADAAFTKPFPTELLITELTPLIRTGRVAELAAVAGDGDGDAGQPVSDRRRRRVRSLQPFLTPPTLRCPMCDGRLQYERSHAGGIGARGAEQWDYFSCARCGTFQYRHRTRKLRRVE
jgi:CheY-like chemotaxis protein